MASLNVQQGVALLKDKQFSDFTIKCAGHAFSVHNNIIYHKSDFFAACISGSFRESSEGTVTIRDAEPVSVALMLLWVYTSRVSPSTLVEVWPELDIGELCDMNVLNHMKTYVLVYELGERLMLPDLKLYLANVIMALVKDQARMLVWSDCGGLRPADTVATLLNHIYTHTTSQNDILRALITAYCVNKHEDLEDWGYKAVIDVIRKHEPVSWNVGRMVKLNVQDK